MAADVTIEWSGENTSLAVGYNVYRSTSTPVSTDTPINNDLIPSNTLSYTDMGVADGTFYYVVEAIDHNDNKELTDEYTVEVACEI